jgi:hypothetical protein
LKWQPVDDIDRKVIERNIYLTNRVASRHKDRITYIDLRFAEVSGDSVKGSVIVK